MCVDWTICRYPPLRELLTPMQEDAFDDSGDLPEVHNMCVLCHIYHSAWWNAYYLNNNGGRDKPGSRGSGGPMHNSTPVQIPLYQAFQVSCVHWKVCFQ